MIQYLRHSLIRNFTKPQKSKVKINNLWETLKIGGRLLLSIKTYKLW